jgi:heterodisulfide reductase subunit B
MDYQSTEKLPAIALYPGCTLETSSVQFRDSLLFAAECLGLSCKELKHWTCCGASSAHALDPELNLCLALRNLALAEQQGYSEVLAPCAACYHRLASANLQLGKDANLRAEYNRRTGLAYNGSVRVRNLLDLLSNVVGTEAIRAGVRRPLSQYRVACYYGCLNTRIPGLELFDDRECPQSMDLIVEALGATPLDWDSRTACCGGSLFLTAQELSAGLVADILRDAAIREADCIVVSCPMCQNNLDVRQPEYCDRFDIPRPIPVLFLTQLMSLAFGGTGRSLGLSYHVVPYVPVQPAQTGRPS